MNLFEFQLLKHSATGQSFSGDSLDFQAALHDLTRGFLVLNFDNCCVELKFTDGSMIAIDTIAVENEVARNMYERSELDYLIYNAPLEYNDLILNGNPETYLKTVTEYKPLD